MNKVNRKYKKGILAILVTGISLVFLIMQIDKEHFMMLFTDVLPLWLLPGAIFYVGAYLARARRFQILLPNHSISFKDIFLITSIHSFAVRIFPNPLGELVFLQQAKRKEIPYSCSIAALLVYRALDFAIVAVFFLVALLPLLSQTVSSIKFIVVISILLFTVSVALIGYLSFAGDHAKKMAGKFVMLFPKHKEGLKEKFHTLIDVFTDLRRRGVYMKATLFSAAVWGSMFLAYYFFIRAFGFDIQLLHTILAGAVQIFANTIPSIAGIGIMEMGWAAGFALVNVDTSIGIVSAFGVDALTLIGTVLLGGFAIAVERGSIFDMSAAKKEGKATGSSVEAAEMMHKSSWRFAPLVIIILLLLMFGYSQRIAIAQYFGLPKGEMVFYDTYPRAVVNTLWIEYRDNLQDDGRTIDRDRNFLTTSEGQSYSLLRAVWMDDHDVFDRTLKWTNENLRHRPSDKLFAWLWGQNNAGKWGILRDDGGINTASDADQDIALALIFAHSRWGGEGYLRQAREILDDIWETEVAMINGRPYLVAGNWAQGEAAPTLNPSYSSFAAYPIFAEIDPTHPWDELKDTSYEVLAMSTVDPLDNTESYGFPPEWVSIDRQSGKIVPSTHEGQTTYFSYNAYRVLWRVALDWKWHRDPRAKAYLEQAGAYAKEWKERGLLYSTYEHDGDPVNLYESYSLYGILLTHFAVTDPELAREVYIAKIDPLYDVDTEEFAVDLGYYPQNWVWFGIALYADQLPNLYEMRR